MTMSALIILTARNQSSLILHRRRENQYNFTISIADIMVEVNVSITKVLSRYTWESRDMQYYAKIAP